MTNRFDVLMQQLFQKNIEDCSVEELQDLANEYPYFAPAQYALLQKLKDSGSDGYQAQLQKAILYYHDPLVFDQFLNADSYGFNFTVAEEKTEETDHVTTLAGDTINEVEQNQNDVIIGPEEQEFIEPESSAETFSEPEPTVETETMAETNSEVELEVENPVADNLVEIPPEEEAVEEKTEDAESEELTVEQETTNLEEPAEETKISDNVEENPEQLAFEPFHTVDYFASQGIKLSQEEATKDRFGKQLKSFTEWLKTMKRLPVNEQVKPLDIRAEQTVENLAAHSVEADEVYTETMAEVWLRQGNKEKAMEIFSKLSLLNPAKRAYFAAKIDSLKQEN